MATEHDDWIELLAAVPTWAWRSIITAVLAVHGWLLTHLIKIVWASKVDQEQLTLALAQLRNGIDEDARERHKTHAALLDEKIDALKDRIETLEASLRADENRFFG